MGKEINGHDVFADEIVTPAEPEPQPEEDSSDDE